MLSINPLEEAPSSAQIEKQVMIARCDENSAVIVYPVGESDDQASGSVAKFTLLLNTIPAESIAIMPAPLLGDPDAMSFVDESFKAISTSKRSRMVVCHNGHGLLLVFFKQIWSKAEGSAIPAPFKSLRDLLGAFVTEILVRREVAFVEVFSPPEGGFWKSSSSGSDGIR